MISAAIMQSEISMSMMDDTVLLRRIMTMMAIGFRDAELVILLLLCYHNT